MTLDYRITREGPDGPVLIAGQTSIDSSRPILIEHKLPRGTVWTRLRFDAQPLPGGKLLVGMWYDEDSIETGSIHWTPRMVLAQGTESMLKNAWGTSGEGRTVRLSLH